MRKEKRRSADRLQGYLVNILMVLGFAYVVATAIFTNAENLNFNNEEPEYLTRFHATSSTFDEDVICPVNLDSVVGEPVTFTYIFDRSYTISNVIMVRSSFAEMTGYLNGKEVFHYGENIKTINKLVPPSAWHIVRLSEPISPGDELTFVLDCSVEPYQGYFRGAYIGTKSSMLYMIIQNARMAFIVSFPLFVLGLLYIVIRGIFPEKTSRKKLFVIGFLSAISAIWILLEAQVIQLAWGLLPVSHTMIFVIFSLLPILIGYLLLQYEMFQHTKLTNIAFYYSIVTFFIFHFLQIAFGYQYVNSVWIIHTAFAMDVITLVYVLVRRFKGKHYKDDMDIIVSGLVFAGFGGLDVINKYVFNELADDVKFVQIGLFGFMLLLGFYTLKRSISEHDLELEQNFWKQVAHTDPLTKLGNRLQFEEERKELRKIKYHAGLTVVIIDINNLKRINDEYGHEMGDVAIATIGRAIHEVFHEYGNCYRIGGDEFCLLLDRINLTLLEEKFLQLDSLLNQNSKDYDVRLSVSCGYSNVSKSGVDAAISLADIEMYKNKTRFKEKRGVSS